MNLSFVHVRQFRGETHVKPPTAEPLVLTSPEIKQISEAEKAHVEIAQLIYHIRRPIERVNSEKRFPGGAKELDSHRAPEEPVLKLAVTLVGRTSCCCRGDVCQLPGCRARAALSGPKIAPES